MAAGRGKRKMVKPGKTIIAVAAVILLAVTAAVFFFGEKLSDSFSESEAAHGKASDNNGQACLNIPKTELQFDGKGRFDPMDGVTAEDVDGSDITSHIAVTYIPTNENSIKKIRYSVFLQNGEKLSESVLLRLENYDAPTITVDTALLSGAERKDMLEDMVKIGAVSADDGFGNDATSALTFTVNDSTEKDRTEITFTLKNMFGDTVVKKVFL